MHFTPSDVRERNSFAEHSLTEAIKVLRDPATISALGAEALYLATIFETATVANYQDGVISLPSRHAADEDSLIVSTVKHGEDPLLSKDFNTQTTLQRDRTLTTFQRMQPAPNHTAQSLYDMFVAYHRDDMGLPTLHVGTHAHAQTGSAARAYTADTLSRFFEKGPSDGLAFIYYRPLLAFVMRERGARGVKPDLTVHEGVHAFQMHKRPFMPLRSQRSVDMWALRIELDAYHAGSIIAEERIRRLHGARLQEEILSISGAQVAINILREEHQMDPSDPYRPSGALLQQLESYGLGTILHTAPSYQALLEVAERSDRIPQAYARDMSKAHADQE